MSAALIVLGGAAYILLSIVFKFTPRVRVVVGLAVGAMLAGVVTRFVNEWTATGIEAVSGPIARLIGQSSGAVAVAIPSVIAFVLATVVIVHLRGKKGGAKSGGGKSGGGGKGGLAHAALTCALLLPIIGGSIGELIRSVSR